MFRKVFSQIFLVLLCCCHFHIPLCLPLFGRNNKNVCQSTSLLVRGRKTQEGSQGIARRIGKLLSRNRYFANKAKFASSQKTNATQRFCSSFQPTLFDGKTSLKQFQMDLSSCPFWFSLLNKNVNKKDYQNSQLLVILIASRLIS